MRWPPPSSLSYTVPMRQIRKKDTEGKGCEGDSPGDNVDENHEIIGVEVKNAVLAGEHVQDQLVDGIRTVPTKKEKKKIVINYIFGRIVNINIGQPFYSYFHHLKKTRG